MEAKSITIESIEKFIFEGDLVSALDYMILATKDLVNNKDIYNDLIQLKSQYTTNVEHQNKGLIKYEDFNIAHAKLLARIIELKDDLEKELSEASLSPKLYDVELELLIYTNAYSYTIRDLEMVAKTLHSQIKAEVIKNTSEAFKNSTLDLVYEVKAIEIVEVGNEFATAHVVQVTKDKNSSFFRNNQTKVSHTFLKEDGRWKFYTSMIQEIKYF